MILASVNGIRVRLTSKGPLCSAGAPFDKPNGYLRPYGDGEASNSARRGQTAMSDIAENTAEIKGGDTGFVWGAAEIGRVIGRNPRQTSYLLDSGALKSARKVGGRWMANRAALIRELTS